jgi:hypothetical protein
MVLSEEEVLAALQAQAEADRLAIAEVYDALFVGDETLEMSIEGFEAATGAFEDSMGGQAFVAYITDLELVDGDGNSGVFVGSAVLTSETAQIRADLLVLHDVVDGTLVIPKASDGTGGVANLAMGDGAARGGAGGQNQGRGEQSCRQHRRDCAALLRNNSCEARRAFAWCMAEENFGAEVRCAEEERDEAWRRLALTYLTCLGAEAGAYFIGVLQGCWRLSPPERARCAFSLGVALGASVTVAIMCVGSTAWAASEIEPTYYRKVRNAGDWADLQKRIADQEDFVCSGRRPVGQPPIAPPFDARPKQVEIHQRGNLNAPLAP